MGDKESENHRSNGLGSLDVQTPVQTAIEVPGLRRGVYDKDDNCIKPSNLTDKLPELRQAIGKKNWLSELLDEVRSGKKKGVFDITPGRLTITVATAALGIEFGIRGGRDLIELWNYISHRFEKEDPTEPKK